MHLKVFNPLVGGNYSWNVCISFGLWSALSTLGRMYDDQTGANDDHFEITYISMDCDDPSACLVQRMSWWVCSLDQLNACSLATRLFTFRHPSLPAIAAFGPNEHLEAKDSNLNSKTGLNS